MDLRLEVKDLNSEVEERIEIPRATLNLTPAW